VFYARIILQVDGKEMAVLIESAINDALDERDDKNKTIRLRCDKSIPFGTVKYILAGVSNSRAENLEWAVLGQ
jgi:biopolymer transport protein ExbD